MIVKNRWQRLVQPALAALLLSLTGCGSGGNGGGTAGIAKTDFKSLSAMAGMYIAYQREHEGKAPQDEQAFRDFLSTKQDVLQRSGLTVEQVFVSPRNGQPLQYVYGKAPPAGSMGMRFFAYEKAPVDGKYLVFGSRGVYELMDEAKLHSLFPDASKSK